MRIAGLALRTAGMLAVSAATISAVGTTAWAAEAAPAPQPVSVTAPAAKQAPQPAATPKKADPKAAPAPKSGLELITAKQCTDAGGSVRPKPDTKNHELVCVGGKLDGRGVVA